MGALSDHFGDQGIQGVTQQAPGCIFCDFRIIWGVPWESLWAPFCDFSVTLGAKMGDCFQVHVFGDPGMEMMPECRGCMCHNHSKNNGF